MSLKASLGMKLRWSMAQERKDCVVAAGDCIVMITLGREKFMQHMLLGVHEATNSVSL